LGKAFKKTSTSTMATKEPTESGSLSEKKSVKPKVGSVNAGLYTDIASVKISKLRKGDSVSTIATKIYTVLKTDMDERKHRAELARNFGNEKLDNERRRHKELLDAIEVAKKKQPKVPVRDPKTGRYVKAETGKPGVPTPPQVGKGQPGAPAAAPKPTEIPSPPAGKGQPGAPSTAPKTQPKVETKAPEPPKTQPKVETKPAEPVKTEPKLETKAPEAPKPTATKPLPEPAPAPTTTPVKPPTGPSAPPTTSKLPPIVAGAVGVTSVGRAIAERMAQRESAGNKPDSYFLANFVRGGDTPGNKMILGSNKIVKGNVDITTGKPFTKSLNEMSIAEVIELSNRRSKFFGKSGAGAAMGKYQFMPRTLAEQVNKVFGPWGMYQPFSEENQELLQQSLMRGNAKALMNSKLPITDANLYLMHFFGNTKQASMVINGKDSDSMADILGPAGSKANPDVAKLTVGEYKKSYLAKSFNMKEITYKELTEDKSLPNVQDATINDKTTGKVIDDSSVENAELKKLMRQNDTLVNINAPTTVIKKQNPKQIVRKPTSPDKPAIAGIP
jgi:hypothetical protein